VLLHGALIRSTEDGRPVLVGNPSGSLSSIRILETSFVSGDLSQAIVRGRVPRSGGSAPDRSGARRTRRRSRSRRGKGRTATGRSRPHRRPWLVGANRHPRVNRLDGRTARKTDLHRHPGLLGLPCQEPRARDRSRARSAIDGRSAGLSAPRGGRIVGPVAPPGDGDGEGSDPSCSATSARRSPSSRSGPSRWWT